MVLSKVGLCRHFNLQPSEVDRMFYWEFELFRDEINRQIEEENKQNKKQQDEMESKYRMNNFNPNSYKQPKMPSMPSFKLPK